MKFRKQTLPHEPIQSAERDAFPAIGTTLSPYAQHPLGHAVVSTHQPETARRMNWKTIAKRAGIVLAIIVLVGGSWAGWKFFSNLNKIFGGNPLDLLTAQRLRGEDRGRVNVLLVGNSADDPGHGGGELTDSIMLVSLDTQNNTAFLLSVPRDLWVGIPEYGHAKINSAYVRGKENDFTATGYPDGGMGQLEQIVSKNFGLPIDYYALVNYTAVRDAVNALGGIDVTIQSSDPRGLYDANISRVDGGPLKLSNGTQHLDGQTALNLTRARGDSYYSYGFPRSDFDRTKHQRQVLIALKDKALSAGTLSNPVKLGSLFDSLGKNVQTDVKSKEVRRFADIVKKIPSSSIKSVSLNEADGKNLLTSYRSIDGQSALTPAAGFDDFSAIQAFVRQLTSTDTTPQQ